MLQPNSYYATSKVIKCIDRLTTLQEEINSKLSPISQWSFIQHIYRNMKVPNPVETIKEQRIPGNYARKDATLLVLHIMIYGYSTRWYERNYGVSHSTSDRIFNYIMHKVVYTLVSFFSKWYLVYGVVTPHLKPPGAPLSASQLNDNTQIADMRGMFYFILKE